MLIFGHPEDSWLDGSTNWGIYKKHKPYEIACPQNLSKVEYNALTFIENTIMCKDSLNDANYLLTHLKV